MQSTSRPISPFSGFPYRPAVAEGLGTLLLVAVVVGSGIMADRLSGGSAGLALLANTLATVFGLFALITTFSGASGAHFNPVVTLIETMQSRMSRSNAIAYVGAQFVGAGLGAVLANTLFGEAVISFSRHERSGLTMALSEFVATFGLVATIHGARRSSAASAPFAVAAWIGAAYWFTPSTSFANPAVTLARCLTDTFAGIRPEDVLPFVVAQLLGAGAAAWVFSWLTPSLDASIEGN